MAGLGSIGLKDQSRPFHCTILVSKVGMYVCMYVCLPPKLKSPAGSWPSTTHPCMGKHMSFRLFQVTVMSFWYTSITIYLFLLFSLPEGAQG